MSRWGITALGMLIVLASACNGGGGSAGERVLQIIAEQDGCTPDTLTVAAGERVKFEVTNRAAQDRELEGIEGTKVEEVLIPKGRTRSISYTVPTGAAVLKLKCYSPGGPATIIQVRVAGEASGSSYQTTKPAAATVNVRLDSFTVTADQPNVSAGPVKFIAKNAHRADVHELAVLRVKADGSLENTGEVEDLDPGKGGEIVLDLPAGKYQLACLIAKGQEGSTVDHYQVGMHIPFEVK